MVPFLVAPALAQNAPPAIVATPAQTGRTEREKLAPAAMAQAEAALQAAQAADMAAFEETVKRLRDVEASDPARALSEYRRFLVGRNPSPVLGVQVALKVSQMRLKLSDFPGALLTCDVVAKKYTSEPSSALLSLQKARVLMGQKKLTQASRCVDEALPDLMALGTQHYMEVSEFLRQLAQANLDSGQEEGKERARALDMGVEQIYLRWLKKDTVDHLWERFKALQADYERVGDERLAKELLPKVEDAVLQLPPDPSNGEDGVVCIEIARWLREHRQSEYAMQYYTKALIYNDRIVQGVALTDQAELLISQRRYGAIRPSLELAIKENKGTNDSKVAFLSLIGASYYFEGDWEKAEYYSKKAIKLSSSLYSDESTSFAGDAEKRLILIQKWSNDPIDVEPKALYITCSPLAINNSSIKERVVVRSFRPIPSAITSSNPDVLAHIEGAEESNGLFFEKSIIVEVSPGSLQKNTQAVLTIKDPIVDTHIPIIVKIDPVIVISTKALFFGKAEINRPIVRSFTLTSLLPFHVTGVQCEGSPVHNVVKEQEKGCKIEVSLVATQAGQIYSGTIRVSTDLKGEEVIEVPYIGKS